MTGLLIFAYLSCAAVFEWGRRYYFRRVRTTTKARGGLAILGPIFVGLNLIVLFTLAAHAPAGRQFVSVALMVLALSIFLWSVSSHSDERPAIAFSSEVPRRLTFKGPYRWVRHPIYLSYSLFWLAPFAATLSLLSAAVFLTMMCLYVTAAKREEGEILRSALANDYLRYRAVTGAFLPAGLRGFLESDDR